MGNMKFIEAMIDSRLLDLHVAFLAKVISTNGTKAKIQPFGIGAVLVDVPIIETARHTVKSEQLTVSTPNGYETRNFAILAPLKAGAIVVCVCSDKDITEAKNGKNAAPKTGSHSLSDAVIVGVLK